METKKQIKSIRAEAGMTQAQFCEYFDIPRRTLEDWECGKRKPPEYLVRLLVYRLSTEGLIEKGADSDERKDTKTPQHAEFSLFFYRRGDRI